MIESFASATSFQPKEKHDHEPPDANGFQPRNAEVDFHGVVDPVVETENRRFLATPSPPF